VIIGFGILLWLGLAFIVAGLVWSRRLAPIVRDRSLLDHPDIQIRSGYTQARLNNITARGLMLAGAVAILIGVFDLLQGPPHPP
jgi:hypothetical protein